MGIQELFIPEIMETSSDCLSKDFFSPVLKHSVRYDRGVGFFTSGWIRATAQGIVPFIEQGGVARWITSPLLNKEDYEALSLGVSAWKDKNLYNILEKEIDNLASSLEEDLLRTIAWLVADRRLIFKIALPVAKLAGGDFHDKFGIFTDPEGNQVSFNGSYNDTAKGELNYESIKIFKSWEPHLANFVKSDAMRFNRLWNGLDPNLKIYFLPSALRAKLVRYRDGLGERPYELVNAVNPPRTLTGAIEPRHYQEEAVEAWIESEYKGILEMATGTGKTITALLCLQLFYNEDPCGIAVILCPYIHLVTQWKEEVDKFGIESVLCFGQQRQWSPLLRTRVEEIKMAKRLGVEKPKKLAIISTYATFFSTTFQERLATFNLPLMLVADEAHNIGTSSRLHALPPQAHFRLGLSATPERFGDEEGTKGLFDFFGGVVFRLGLREAIFDLEVLSHYTYEIHFVQLSDTEFEEYKELTRQIAQLISDPKHHEGSPQLESLLSKRSTILNTAYAKLDKLRELLSNNQDIKKTLFYCAPGQITEVNRVLAREFKIVSHQITYKENRRERTQIIGDFERGNYQALTAIKCLDEGVDIPAVDCAFIMASSANPREFIQRRGRILRRAEGKERARIIDIMTSPPDPELFTKAEFNLERSILTRELRRIRYFSSCANNRNQALLSVYEFASRYNLQHVLLEENQ
jgi:superfamily II DNA or RNA helicase